MPLSAFAFVLHAMALCVIFIVHARSVWRDESADKIVSLITTFGCWIAGTLYAAWCLQRGRGAKAAIVVLAAPMTLLPLGAIVNYALKRPFTTPDRAHLAGDLGVLGTYVLCVGALALDFARTKRKTKAVTPE
jgi:hypothetical protein